MVEDDKKKETKVSSDDSSVSPPNTALEPVEGLKAWLVVLGSFLMHWVTLGSIYTVGLFLPVYEELYGRPRQELTLIGTLQVGLLFGFGVFTGKLGDKYGVKRVYGVGCILYLIGTFCASFATEFWHVILTQGVITGAGLGFMYWPAVTIVPMWFDKRRGLATALAVLGSGIGQFANGLILQTLLDSNGVEYTLRILTLFSGALLLTGFFLLKRRLPLEKDITFFTGWSIFRDKIFILISISACLFQFGFHVPFAHLPAYLEDLNIGNSQFLGLAVGLIGAGSAVGRVTLGFLSDKIGRLFCYKLTLLATAVTLLSWYWCTTEASVLAFSFIYGFVSGGFIALIFPVLGEYYGVHQLGAIGGYVSITLLPGSFVGPYMAGKFFDDYGNYEVAILVCSGFLFLSSGITFLLPSPEKVNRATVLSSE